MRRRLHRWLSREEADCQNDYWDGWWAGLSNLATLMESIYENHPDPTARAALLDVSHAIDALKEDAEK